MQKILELDALMPMLPVDVRDGVNAVLKEEGQPTDKARVLRSVHAEKAKTNQLEEGSRTAVKYVSTRDVDSEGDVVVPSGVVFSEFRKSGMPFFWGHNYSLPPLGSDTEIEADEKGVKATSDYADTGEGTMANIVWALVQQGHQQQSSIGYVPLKMVKSGDKDFPRTVEKLAGQWPELAKQQDSVARILTKTLLLEHSDVGIGMNNNTSVVAVAKGLGANDDMLKVMGIDVAPPPPEDKGVIAYADHGKAPEAEKWNGPAEVAAADMPVMRIISTWFDAENTDLKSAYKLPHHKAGGAHAAVWAGVSAAMGALLGARGGVQIPPEDRKGVYNHLAKHYTEFEKAAPELREYNQGELRKAFPDLYETIHVELPRSVVPVQRSVQIVGPGSKARIEGKEARIVQAVQDALDGRRGRL